MTPVNIAAGYFGAVGWHEGGHAFTAMALDGQDITVTVWPTKDDEGSWHLGLTTARFEIEEFSELDRTLFRTMGPTAMWVGHIGTRGLLRSGCVPKIVQPTLAWFGLMNRIGYYGQVLMGLARFESTDLGQEDTWISGVMLGGALAVDAIDLLTGDFEKHFGVLFGESFYGEDDEERLGVMAAPMRNGGYFGLWMNW